MALLTVQYTAPLPVGFTSGTVELKSGSVYIDASGRVNQPYRKYTLGSDKSLTSLQGDATPVIVGMAMGDPATAGPLDVIVTQIVTGLPTPLRSTFRVVPLDTTGGGNLNLHAPSLSVPVVGPYPASIAALITTATSQQAAVSTALTSAGTATTAANSAATLATNAASSASVAAGLLPWSGGDHTTIPSTPGYYRLLGSAESGQVWQRTASTLVRHTELESSVAGSGTFISQVSAVIDATSRTLSPPTGAGYAALQISGCAISARFDSTPSSNGAGEMRYANGGLVELLTSAEIAAFTYIAQSGSGSLSVVYRSS